MVRLCPAHRVELTERDGSPYCPWQAGHYPDRWIVVDKEKPGRETIAAPDAIGVREVESWRAKTAPAPRPRPAAPPPRAKPPADDQVKADRPTKEETMPAPKCSRCGGDGHNRRTCREGGGSEAPAARTRKARAPASTAIALTTRVREELEQRREEHVRAAMELDRALQTFDLLESIPKQHVAAARAVLEAAGADLGASKTDARQRLALSKILAGVGAVLFAASLRSARKRQGLIEAAAAAIGAEGDTQAA